MPNNRRISPLTIILLLMLLVLLPLGLYTLSTAMGATAVTWLLPNGGDNDAADAEARLRQAADALRAPTPDANSNQILRVRFAATVPTATPIPTPTPGVLFLPLVAHQNGD
jgi:hypothetical protein